MTSGQMDSQIYQVVTKQEWKAPLIVTLQSSEAEGKIVDTPGEGLTIVIGQSYAPS